MTIVNDIANWLLASFNEASAMTLWEAVAVLLAIAYLLLAMRRNLWCWPAAAGSTLIYIVLFWQVALLMESLLNGFYLFMAGYGFWQWRYGGDGSGIPMVQWSLQRHIRLIVITTLVALGLGFVMDNYTHADFAYLDALTTSFAVITTVMIALKVVENWLYWVVIDAASIYLYLNKGLNLTAALFVLYVVLAVIGYRQWLRAYRRETAPLVGQADCA